MNGKRFLAFILAFAMVFTTMSFPALAEEANFEYVSIEADDAMVDEDGYKAQGFVVSVNNVGIITEGMSIELYNGETLLSTTAATKKRINNPEDATDPDMTIRVVWSGDAEISSSWKTTMNDEVVWSPTMIPNKIVVTVDGVTKTYNDVEIWGAEWLKNFELLSSYVAKIGDVGYESFKEAFAAMQTGDTVDLLGKTIVLENERDNNTFTIKDKDVTFTNGTFDVTGFDSTPDNINSIFDICNDSQVVFKEVDFIGEGYKSANGVIYVHDEYWTPAQKSEVTLENCDFTLKSEEHGMGGVLKGLNAADCKYTVTNCNFDLTDTLRIFANVTVDVTGGTIETGNTAVSDEHAFRNVYGEFDGTKITVSNFQNGIKNTEAKELAFVNGATFTSSDMAEYDVQIKNGAVVTFDETSTCTIENTNAQAAVVSATAPTSEETSVAMVGATFYATLEEAIGAAHGTGETIKLLGDVEFDKPEPGSIYIPYVRMENFTIDLNGHTLTLPDLDYKFADVTFANGNIELTHTGVVGGSAVFFITADDNSSAEYNMVFDNVKLSTLEDFTAVNVVSSNSGNDSVLITNGSEFTVYSNSGDQRFYAVANMLNLTIEKNSKINHTDGNGKGRTILNSNLDATNCTITSTNVKSSIYVGGKTINLGENVTVNATINENSDETAIFEEIKGTVTKAESAVVNEKINGVVAKIGDVSYKTFKEAFIAAKEGDTITIVANGTYTLPVIENVTLEARDGVEAVFEINSAVARIKNVTFKNVTFKYADKSYYIGLQHSENLAYENCKFVGQVFLYANKETFKNCTFEQASADAYNVWTYGAKEVTFEECTFNSNGKSVLIYNEGGNATNANFTKCEFVAVQAVEGKAAIEIDTSLMPAGTTIKVNECTATGFATGSVSGNSLWNDKKNKENLTVEVNNETVWPLPKMYAVQFEACKNMVEGSLSAEVLLLTLGNVGRVENEMSVELFYNDTLLTKTTANEKRLHQDYNELSVTIISDGDAAISGSWNTAYVNENWTVDMVPNKAVVTIDGVVTELALDTLVAPEQFKEFTRFNKETPENPAGLDKLLVIWGMDKKGGFDTSYPVHIYAGIDSLDYKEVGFKVKATNTKTGVVKEMTISTKTVYESMQVREADGSLVTYEASQLGGTYMFGTELLFSTENWSNEDTVIEITPYAIEMDGETVVEVKTTTVSDAIIQEKYPDKGHLFKED